MLSSVSDIKFQVVGMTIHWRGQMFDCELVGKIGSMALIRRDEYDIDYNVFSRVGAELVPVK